MVQHTQYIKIISKKLYVYWSISVVRLIFHKYYKLESFVKLTMNINTKFHIGFDYCWISYILLQKAGPVSQLWGL